MIRTGGGGGYGPAWNRDVERVKTDVRLGYVSESSALLDYGVVFGDELAVDIEATAIRRRDMSQRQNIGRERGAAA